MKKFLFTYGVLFLLSGSLAAQQTIPKPAEKDSKKTEKTEPKDAGKDAKKEKKDVKKVPPSKPLEKKPPVK